MTDNDTTTTTDASPDNQIQSLERRVAELEAMTEVDSDAGGVSLPDLLELGLTRRQALMAIALVGAGYSLGPAITKSISEPAAASHGGADLGTEENPLGEVYIEDLYSVSDNIAADSVDTDNLVAGSASIDNLHTDSRLYDAVVWTDGSTYYADGRGSEVASGSSFSTVFQAALDSAVTSNRDNGTVAVAKGTYAVDALIDVREGVTVEASQGAIFEPASDADMFRMVPDAAWHGGAVNARNGVGFSSDVFLHEGTSSGQVMHGPRNQTPITDVFIALPDTTGTAVALRPLDENSSHVTWTCHDRIAVYGGERGFALEAPATTGYSTPPYANANYFTDCVTFQTVESIYLESPDESVTSGNLFDRFSVQAGTDSQSAVDVQDGSRNQFRSFFVWDWNVAAGSGAVYFRPLTYGNVYEGYVNPSDWNDAGANVINGYTDVGTAPSNSSRWQGEEDVAEELGVMIWDTSTSPPTPYRAFDGSYIALL